jgi:dTDP-4-dehydrorhamnose 3,5-epimerase
VGALGRDRRSRWFSYRKWFRAELTEDNRSMLYIPRGFVHGCIPLNDNVEGKWCRMRGLNPRPSVYKTAALPLS